MTLERRPVVAAVDDRLRTTSICLGVGYGSRDDPDGQGGLAHLLEHLLMSVPGRGGRSFSEQVERLGGRANAETGLERMLFYVQVHAQDADEVAAALLAAVDRPDLTAGQLEAERAVVLQELAAAAADPADVVQDAFLATLFAGHPLGRPVGGSPDEVRSATVEQVRAEHARLFRPRPMAVAVVGPRVPAPLDGPAGIPVAQARPPVPLGAPGGDGGPAWPEEFAWTCIGGRSAPLGQAGREAYPVLGQLLGASPSSLLYRRLRGELGLAYAFQAWDRGYTEAGAWRVLVGVDGGNGTQVAGTVVALLDELATAGPSADDLDAARRQARMQLILDLETPLEHARLLAVRATAGVAGPVEDELAALERVDADQVRAAAAAILDGLVTVVRPEGVR